MAKAKATAEPQIEHIIRLYEEIKVNSSFVRSYFKMTEPSECQSKALNIHKLYALLNTENNNNTRSRFDLFFIWTKCCYSMSTISSGAAS